jgi:hypothetical protein
VTAPLTLTRHRTRTTVPALALAVLLALVTTLLPGAAARAQAPAGIPVPGGSLAWAISDAVRTSGSLNGILEAEGGATVERDADGLLSAFVLPLAEGTFDPASSALDLRFDGTVTFGNEGRGDYTLSLSDVRITVRDGVAVMSASVGGETAGGSFGGGPAVEPGPFGPTEVAELAVWDVTVGRAGLETVTPRHDVGPEGAARGFSTEFIDALSPALRSWFFATGSRDNPEVDLESPANLSKLLLPFEVELVTGGAPTPAPAAPAVEVPMLADVTGAPLEGGALLWGVRGSFAGYVLSPVASGAITDLDGAPVPPGPFRFAVSTGSVDVDARALDVTFAGGVRFTGHETDGEPALDVTFSALRVVIVGDEGVVMLDARSRGLEADGISEFDGVTLAVLDASDVAFALDGTTLTLDGVAAVLTAEGAEAFAGFYEAGEQLDALTLELVLAGAAVDAAQDGVSRTLLIAGLIVALLVVALVVRRRRSA